MATEKLTHTEPVAIDLCLEEVNAEKSSSRKRKRPAPTVFNDATKAHLDSWVLQNHSQIKKMRKTHPSTPPKEDKPSEPKKKEKPAKKTIDPKTLGNIRKHGYTTKVCQIGKLLEFLGESKVTVTKLATFNKGRTWKVRTSSALDHLAALDDMKREEKSNAAKLSDEEFDFLKDRFGKRWWTVSKLLAQKIRQLAKEGSPTPMEEESSTAEASEKKKKPPMQTSFKLKEPLTLSLSGYTVNEQMHPSSSAKPTVDQASKKPFLFVAPVLEIEK